jgi:hypothetical protein
MAVTVQSPGERRSLPPAGVLVAALLLAACSAPQSPPRYTAPSPRVALDAIDTLADRLDCSSFEILRGDISFYDPMNGVDCYYDDGTAVLLRAYESEASARQVLVGLAGTFTSENQYVLGANWYAMGSPSRLRALLSELGVDLEVSTRVDTAVPRLDSIDEATGTCMSFVASLIRAELEGREPQGDYSDVESVYPEITTVVRNIVPAVDTGPDSVDARISRHTDELRSFCRDLEESRGK